MSAILRPWSIVLILVLFDVHDSDKVYGACEFKQTYTSYKQVAFH